MNFRDQKTKEIIGTSFFVLVVIFSLQCILFPTFTDQWPFLYKAYSLHQIKEICNGLAIYVTDYDDRFPATSAMPGTRAVLHPYLKNRLLFEGSSTHYSEPTYNFSVAGVEASLPRYFGAKQQDVSKVGVWQAQVFKNTPGTCISFADTHAKFFPVEQSEKVIDAFDDQFDRLGATLMPANYLAEYDPLKGMK